MYIVCLKVCWDRWNHRHRCVTARDTPGGQGAKERARARAGAPAPLHHKNHLYVTQRWDGSFSPVMISALCDHSVSSGLNRMTDGPMTL